MADLVRATNNSLTNPRIVFGWQPTSVDENLNSTLKAGFFQPIDSMSFRVLQPDGTEEVALTVVDPSDPANQLDADTDKPGRLIVPPFTVAPGSPTGTYTIEVTFVAHPEGGSALPSKTVSWQFRVLDEALGWEPKVYAQLQDMIDQGFPVADPAPTGGYTLDQGRAALRRATRYIEEITNRYFSPRFLSHDHDGQGGPILQTGHVIVGLTDIRLTFTTFSPADLPISEGDVRVYNRHLRQEMVQEDDRNDPRIEFLRTPNYSFPRGQIFGETDLLSGHINFVESTQNVKLVGVWGYTDPDGSPFGKTPDLVVELCLRLAARYIGPLWANVGGAGAQSGIAGPILSERTMDQSVTFANLSGNKAGSAAYSGMYTGDPEIDQLLALYMAPIICRSA